MINPIKSAIVATTLLAAVGFANAATVYTFNTTAVGAFGAAPYGTVTLTQNGANVDVAVALRSDLNFVNTGGPHDVFTFNATGVSVGDISNIKFNGVANANYTAVAPGANTPFGSFTLAIDCTGAGCANGAPGQAIDPLTFTVASALESHFGGVNLAGFSFGADVICFTGSCNGSTGAIAVGTPTNNTPEPGTLALAGLALVGVAVSRRRKQ